MDLANVYLVRKEEAAALKIIEECCEITEEIEPTQRISLFDRKIDLLLHIHDYLQRNLVDLENNNRKRPAYTNEIALRYKMNVPTAVVPTPTVLSQMQSGERCHAMVTALEMFKTLAEKKERELKESAAKEDDFFPQELVSVLEKENSDDLFPDEAVCGSEAGNVPESLTSSNLVDSLGKTETRVVHTQNENKIGNCEIVGVPSSVRAQHDVIEQGGESSIFSVGSCAVDPAVGAVAVEENSPHEFTVEHSQSVVKFKEPIAVAESDEVALIIERVQKAQQFILQWCRELTDASIDIHRQHYKTDLTEPSSFAVVLMQRSKVEERAYDGSKALEYAELAETAALRAVGGGTQLSVSIMLEVGVFFNYFCTVAVSQHLFLLLPVSFV
jgi:hypothetical protein